MNKVAIPTRDGNVDDHFGHCEFYTIYTINEKKEVTNVENFAAPQGCGCKSGVAQILADKGVNMLLAGNIGMGALNTLQYYGINVIRGCSGKTEDVISIWLNNNLTDSGESCHSHEGCNHN